MALVVKNLPTKARDAGDMGSIPGLGRFPRKGHGNPLQCSCLENPMNRGAWPAIVHGVTKNGHNSASEHVRTHTHTHTQNLQRTRGPRWERGVMQGKVHGGRRTGGVFQAVVGVPRKRELPSRRDQGSHSP